jgi:hypothetical protein
MINQLTLFELQEKEYIPFGDVIHLKGEEKRIALDKMRDFMETFKNIESPTKIEKRQYYRACCLLESDALRQLQRLKVAVGMFDKMKKEIILRELEIFKTKIKLAFMEKYQAEISSGTFTQEMSKELDKITRMEKVGCYQVNGIDISMKDCNICKYKICQKKPKLEEDEDNESEVVE